MDVAALEQSYDVAQEVLAKVDPKAYELPTPCKAWNVWELVNHLVGATFWFASSLRGGAADDRDGSAMHNFVADPVRSFNEGAKAAVVAFSTPGALNRMLELDLPFGRIPGSGLLVMAINDSLTHAWDLAKATGQSTDLLPGLAADLLATVRGSLPDSFRGPEGSGAPFGPVQVAPAGASAAAQLAAFLGRAV